MNIINNLPTIAVQLASYDWDDISHKMQLEFPCIEIDVDDFYLVSVTLGKHSTICNVLATYTYFDEDTNDIEHMIADLIINLEENVIESIEASECGYELSELDSIIEEFEAIKI